MSLRLVFVAFRFLRLNHAGFSNFHSPCGLLWSKNQLWNAQKDSQKFSEKENAENTQRLMMKIEYFC